MPRRPYGLVEMPQPQMQNPLQSLSAIMNLAGHARELGEQRKADESKTAIETAFNASKGDLDLTIDALQKQGRWSEASGLKSQRSKIVQEGFKTQSEQDKAASERLKLGAQLVQPLDDPEIDDASLTARFPSVRGELVNTFGDQPFFPPPDAPAAKIRAFVSAAVQKGMSASEHAARRAAALDETRDRLLNAKTQNEIDEALGKGVARYVGTLDTPEEWDLMVTGLKNAGASETLLGKVGTYSPERVAEVEQMFSETPESIDARLDEADRRGDKAEVQRLLTLKGRAAAVTRDTSGEDRTTKRQAETWRANELSELATRKMKAGEPYTDWSTSPPRQAITKALTEAEVKAEEERIERDYQRMLRGGPGSAPPAEPSRGATPALADRNGRTPPPVVADFFKDKGAGTATFSDGSKWKKSADGTIAPVR